MLTTPPSSLELTILKASCYAGIGSRATPPEAQALIWRVARHLALLGAILRSGAARGADAAFEAGCDSVGGRKEIFLPWEGFNDHPSPFFDPPPRAMEIAALCHPRWRQCRPKARLFHARNVQQVCGRSVDDPVDLLLFWAPEEAGGTVQGGTATAVTLARRMGVPTYNLWDAATCEALSALLPA